MHYIPKKQLFLLDLPLQLKPWNVDAARYIGWDILIKRDLYFSDVNFPVIESIWIEVVKMYYVSVLQLRQVVCILTRWWMMQ